jgi:predicted RND superfamily exporter protein
VSQALIDSVVTTQIRSVVFSLVGILALMALLWRSLRGGILGMLPSAVALWIALGMMGWLGIPLGVATSMFTGITVGIGVDYAIHLRDRYRHVRGRGVAVPEALVDAAVATGPAVLLHATALGLGFGVLLFSGLPANARLGGLLTVTLLGCLLTTLFLLPPLESAFGRGEGVPWPRSGRAGGGGGAGEGAG